MPSLLALAVLALLYEAPMHPYRMQQLIKERGKDDVINVRQRASLYQTIRRLERDGLIAVRETVREEGRPDKTIYEITEVGRQTLIDWLRAMLATPADEFPAFPAALAYLALLTPQDACALLKERLKVLDQKLGHLNNQLQEASAAVPRLFLIEYEYLCATLTTERDWVTGLIADLNSGALSWDNSWPQTFEE